MIDKVSVYLRALAASLCTMLRKLMPFTSRTWSPTCTRREHKTTDDNQ